MNLLDEDGDGEVSIFEMMHASKAKRAEAVRALEHGASETISNLEELVVDGEVDEREGGHGSHESAVRVGRSGRVGCCEE